MFCSHPVERTVLDLGSAPLSNAYLTPASLQRPESWIPLRLVICTNCLLVQVAHPQQPEGIFDANYAYFSSYSGSWLRHAESLVAQACDRLSLGTDSFVVELASNDGYLLQYVLARGIPCLGIEPTQSTAEVSISRGIETRMEFFGLTLARQVVAERGHANLVIANNVLAHVPDINDFVAGIAELLGNDGRAVIEFPHLARLVQERQFDTVYHEHYSYLSLHVADRILREHGLMIWDVERLPTHGGSLRIWACSDAAPIAPTPAFDTIMEGERLSGLCDPSSYDVLQQSAIEIKNDLLSLLIEEHRAKRRVVAYGAAAKGNTLLNFAGVRPDLIEYVVDRNPHKQGLHMPGCRIPIVPEQALIEAPPDTCLILPWNLTDELLAQLNYLRVRNVKFVTAVPKLKIH